MGVHIQTLIKGIKGLGQIALFECKLLHGKTVDLSGSQTGSK